LGRLNDQGAMQIIWRSAELIAPQPSLDITARNTAA
jgi:hypothetical protein